MRRWLPRDLAVHVSKAFPPTGTKPWWWPRQQMGSSQGRTYSAYHPSSSPESRPWVELHTDQGLLRVEFSEIKAAEIGVGNLMSLEPNPTDRHYCWHFSPTGVENCCRADRLVGTCLTSDWMSQTWASKSVCPTLRFWFVVLFLWFRTLNRVGEGLRERSVWLCLYRSLAKRPQVLAGGGEDKKYNSAGT